MSVIYLPRDERWDIIGNIIGQALIKRAQEKQDKEDVQVLIKGLEQPDFDSRTGEITTYTDLTPQGTAVKQQTTQGLINKGLLGNSDWLGQNRLSPSVDSIGQGLFGAFNAGQTPSLAQPTFGQPLGANPSFNNPFDRYKPENNPVKVETKTRTIDDVLRDAKQAWYKNFKETATQMSPSAFKQYFPTLKAAMESHLAELKNNYNNQRISEFTNKLNNAKNIKEATAYAMAIERLGGKIHPELIKAAWADPDYDIKMMDLGGTKKIMAINKKNPSEMMDLYTGEVTPKPASTIVHISNGGRSNGSKPIASQQYFQNYQDRGGLEKDLALIEEYNQRVANGEEIKPSEQRMYNAASARLNAYWRQSGVYNQPEEQPETNNNEEGAAWYDQTFREIKAQRPDASDEEIYQFMTDLIKANGG